MDTWWQKTENIHDLINGNNFANIADYSVTLDNSLKLQIKEADFVFCKTDFLSDLFTYKKNDKPYTLISGMADEMIDKRKFVSKPNNVVKWYAVNAVYRNRNIVPIPLGIENHTGKSKGGYTDHVWFVENRMRLKLKLKENVIYCNWNNKTNKKREAILSKLKQNNLPLRVESNLSFYEYCESMAECKYVVCPPGNGVDTHRVWEALYMGCIPIVLKNNVFSFYYLPIIQVDNFSNVTENILNQERLDNYEQLYMNYWIKIIRGNE